MIWRELSIWYLIATPIAGALSVIGEFQIAGKNYSGFIWMSLLVLGVYLLGIGALWTLNRGALMLWSGWFVWFGFVWLSLLWCSIVDEQNVQNALQMSMPLVVGMLATSAIRSRDDLRRFLHGFAIAGGILAILAVAFLLTPHSKSDLDAGPRDQALLAVLIGGIAYGAVPQYWRLAIVGWGGCLAFTLISGSRIASIALMAMPVMHVGYRYLRWNLVGIVVAATLAAGLFHTPLVQERLFHSGSGEPADLFSDNVNSAGRFEAWPYVWEETWKHPWWGAGVGAVGKFVPSIWEEMVHVHNDYLRVGFEFGLVGLTMFVTVALWQLLKLYRIVRHSDGILRFAAAAAWLGFCGLLITCATDNTLIYNLYYTDPLFALIGAVYGVVLADESKLECQEKYHRSTTGALLA